ncbi:hypothetical protein BB559_003204 [Furculomyces boomerangus]|uniref:Uncharacterized protein n=2 Tax=Harpellales TaxID=61421 RepID=A0A2T9YMR6_9FUNG|nr:hypothetical protein BB559_003204 [Furculomyces boomerangus]PWA00709.1 hypothetical protein BB558_003233 [Smittium angustum]
MNSTQNNINSTQTNVNSTQTNIISTQITASNFTQISPNVLAYCPPSNSTCFHPVAVCNASNVDPVLIKTILESFSDHCPCVILYDQLSVYKVDVGNGVGVFNNEIKKCSGSKSYKWKSSILLLGLLVFLV